MFYCDKCAEEKGYPINDNKVKGACEVCFSVIGNCNFTDDDMLPFNNIDKNTLEVGGFIVKQQNGFPPKIRVDMVEPKCKHRFLSNNKVMFEKEDSIVFANMATGERIEVKY